jgi:phage tail sheath protein FI
MPFQVSPGVNVSEIDLTTVVPAVSTTEGAFAGQFRWGPVEQRVLVDSEDRLVKVFSKPNANNAEDFFTAANFLAYGNALYTVRVVGTGSKNSFATGNTAIQNGNASVLFSNSSLIKNKEAFDNGTFTRVFYGRYAGALGNSLKVSVCANTTQWQSNTTLTYSITRNSSEVTITSNTTVVSAKISIGDLLVLGADGEQRKVRSIAAAANTARTIVTLTSNYSGANLTSNTNLVRRWEYFNSFDRAPGTTAYATSNGLAADALHVIVVDEDGTISGVRDTVLEKYENVSTQVAAKTETGASSHVKTVINESSEYIYCGTAPTRNSGRSYSLVGGLDGADVTKAQKIVGYDLFKSAEDVDVSFILGGNADQTLATYLISSIAESRKDCIAVISPERADVVNTTTATDNIIAFRNTLPSSSYAVMDSGYKYQYDKYNDVYRYIPLCADTAGLMVQTDQTRDPWFSPAGFNRGNVKNVIKLAFNPAKGARDQLYKNGINPVVTFPGQGTVLFGDKTLLAQPSAFDRINVRRLFIVLEKAISTASKFTLFEFNDEFTRSQFKNLVEPFLRDVQGRRGITDFRVVCDSTNNTGEVIDRNEFIGDIYIKPARSINFIQLNFVAVRTGVEFSEIVGQF